MLQIPRLRQPDDVTCLPTCVRSVLVYRGYAVSDEEVADACRVSQRGSVLDSARDGLAEAGFDVDLCQFDGINDLREHVQDDQPVVVIPRHPSGSLHAVVVCDVTPVGVLVMDPALGDYTTLPTARFEDLWCRVQNEGLIVSGARPARRQVSGGSE